MKNNDDKCNAKHEMRRHFTTVELSNDLPYNTRFLEESAIRHHLYCNRGDMQRTAKTLGISRQSLYNKCGAYKVDVLYYRGLGNE